MAWAFSSELADLPVWAVGVPVRLHTTPGGVRFRTPADRIMLTSKVVP